MPPLTQPFPPSQANRWSTLAIVASWLTARVYAYYHNWAFFKPANADYSTFHMWYLPPDYIKDHFWESLLYLRGEPPLPQTILGILMKIFDWPLEYPFDSFLLSAMTLVSAVLMRDIMMRYNFRCITSTALASIWCLTPGSVAVEIDAFPIAFYEALPAFFLVIALWLCIRTQTTNDTKTMWQFGAVNAAISMSRSTLSWFFVIPVFISLFFRGKGKIIAGTLALLVQLLWAGKNFAVYQQFHLETASDVGQNIFSTILNTGNADSFIRYSQTTHPDNPFVARGLPCLAALDLACVAATLPDTRALDTQLARAIPEQDQLYGETYFMHALSSQLKPLYFDYLLHNPARALDMLSKSYRLFWGRIYWQVPYIPGLDTDKLTLDVAATMEWYKYFCIAVIHSFTLAAVLVIFVRIAKGQRPDALQLGLLYAVAALAYVGIVSSFGDHGENARYRVAVEPIVWLLPFMTLACLQALRKGRAAGAE